MYKYINNESALHFFLRFFKRILGWNRNKTKNRYTYPYYYIKFKYEAALERFFLDSFNLRFLYHILNRFYIYIYLQAK